MDNYFFSATNNTFYPASLREDYKSAGNWPADAVEVSDDIYQEFAASLPPKGKVRIVGEDGYPAWADIPPPTHDELVAMADSQKQSLIDQANVYMGIKQWPGKAAMGRLTDTDKAQYNTWLDYLDALEAVDTSTAPDITWPVAPAA